MPKESRSRMQKWPSSTSCSPNSTVTGTTHFYPMAIRSAHVICAQALKPSPKNNANCLAGQCEKTSAPLFHLPRGKESPLVGENLNPAIDMLGHINIPRSEERRVGKEC